MRPEMKNPRDWTSEHLERISRALKGLRLDLVVESRAQQQVAEAFDRAGLSYRREAPLGAPGSGSRADFLVGHGPCRGIVVELKVDGSPMAIHRQVLRYAEFEEVTAVVLVTSKVIPLPRTVAGKPCRVVWTAANWI